MTDVCVERAVAGRPVVERSLVLLDVHALTVLTSAALDGDVRAFRRRTISPDIGPFASDVAHMLSP